MKSAMPMSSMLKMARAGADLPPMTGRKTYSGMCYSASLFLAVFLLPFCTGVTLLLTSVATQNVSYMSFALIGQSFCMVGFCLTQVKALTRTKDSFILKRFGGDQVVVPLSDFHSVELQNSCGMRMIRINYTDSYVAKMRGEAGACSHLVADNAKVVLDHISEFTTDHGMIALSDAVAIEVR